MAKEQKTCKIDGCGSKSTRRGMCTVHYRQHAYQGTLCQMGDAPSGRGRKAASDGLHKGPHGYVWCQIPGRRVYEHRYVIEQMLGHALPRGATVHHKNGDKSDNRPENLELWCTPQPRGQRLGDVLAYLVHYRETDLREAMRDGIAVSATWKERDRDGETWVTIRCSEEDRISAMLAYVVTEHPSAVRAALFDMDGERAVFASVEREEWK
jgi:hypothetical protein